MGALYTCPINMTCAKSAKAQTVEKQGFIFFDERLRTKSEFVRKFRETLQYPQLFKLINSKLTAKSTVSVLFFCVLIAVKTDVKKMIVRCYKVV